MKAAVSLLLVALAVPVATPASAAVGTKRVSTKQSAKAADERIERRFKADPSLKRFDIKASVDNGVAKLSGTVATDAERQKAADLAKVSGITRVDNQIAVDFNAGQKGTAGKLEDKAKQVGQKTKEGAEKVGEKTKEGLSKTGEVITDAWITGRVHTRFVGEDLLKGSDINVDTTNHVVTLKGTVMSSAARAKAVQIARGTEGVHRVVSHLTIGPKK